MDMMMLTGAFQLWSNFHAPEDVEVNLKDTLKSLGVDYLDLYLIHWPMAFPVMAHFNWH